MHNSCLFDEPNFIRKDRTEDEMISRNSIINSSYHQWEKGQQLIEQLKHDYSSDIKIRVYLIKLIQKKIYPNRKRITVTIIPWNQDLVQKIVIDSSAKKCNDCGKRAYYKIYNSKYLSKWSWRICWRCLSPYNRELIQEYYSLV